jgi:hypothetical protein
VSAALLLASPAPVPVALAQRGEDRPSPEELWRDYPLTQAPGEQAPAPQAGSAPTQQERRPPPAQGAGADAGEPDGGDGGDNGVLVVLLVAGVGVAGAAVLLYRRAQARPRAGTAAGRPTAPPPEPIASASPAGPRDARRTPAAASPAPAAPELPETARPRPDDDVRGPTGTFARARTASRRPASTRATERWTAEVQWSHHAGVTSFRAVGTSPGRDEHLVLAESPPTAWPPRSDDAVRSLVDAVDVLERALVDAGWEPTAPGDAWYARRFVWPQPGRPPAPVAAQHAPADRS